MNKVFVQLNKGKKTKMNAKNILVSFLTIVSVLFLVTTVSAYTVDGDLASDITVKANGMYIDNNVVSVIAGETITVKVWFTSDVDDSDVTVEAEIEGEKVDFKDITESFDVEDGSRYRKALTLEVPYELKDEVSDIITLNIEIDGKEYKTEIEDIELRVQRPSYNADIKSITVSNSVEAGETFPVDIVLKNVGYNDLDDLYVSVSISALNIEKTAYFGDLVALEDYCNECNDDDEDTVSGRLYLKVPFDANAGIYMLEVEVTNDDTINSVVKQIIVENDFSEYVIVSASRKTVAVGENAEYDLLIVNPTNKLKVYRVITESSGSLSSNTNEAVVAVPAGSSKTVTITANADTEGEYNFNVNVLSGEELVSTVILTANVEGKSQITSPIIVLTIILAIVFLVLLVVLIVLITKKPEKTEEFGESYY